MYCVTWNWCILNILRDNICNKSPVKREHNTVIYSQSSSCMRTTCLHFWSVQSWVFLVFAFTVNHGSWLVEGICSVFNLCSWKASCILLFSNVLKVDIICLRYRQFLEKKSVIRQSLLILGYTNSTRRIKNWYHVRGKITRLCSTILI